MQQDSDRPSRGIFWAKVTGGYAIFTMVLQVTTYLAGAGSPAYFGGIHLASTLVFLVASLWRTFYSVSGFHLLDRVVAANTADLSGCLWPDGAKLQSVLPVDFIPGGFAVFWLFALDERDVGAGTGGRIRRSATGHLILRRIPAQTDSVKVHRDRAASECFRWRLIFYLPYLYSKAWY